MAEEVFNHKHLDEDGDITEIRIFKVKRSANNHEGISYSLVFIRKGERLLGYDNFEGHKKEGNMHHKHVRNRIIPYDFVDEWKLVEDFNEDVEKIKRGAIK